jgi:hypothetical protein
VPSGEEVDSIEEGRESSSSSGEKDSGDDDEG